MKALSFKEALLSLEKGKKSSASERDLNVRPLSCEAWALPLPLTDTKKLNKSGWQQESNRWPFNQHYLKLKRLPFRQNPQTAGRRCSSRPRSAPWSASLRTSASDGWHRFPDLSFSGRKPTWPCSVRQNSSRKSRFSGFVAVERHHTDNSSIWHISYGQIGEASELLFEALGLKLRYGAWMSEKL